MPPSQEEPPMKMNALILKQGFGLAAVFCALSLMSAQTFADASGRAGRSGATAGVTCASAACHAVGAAIPTVTITGPASVAAGSTTTYTVMVAGGPAATWGIDVAAAGATLTTSGTGTKLLRNEIVHSAPSASGTFTFNLVAPAAPGTATIFAAGLSGDKDGTEAGDGTGTTSMTVTVTAAGGGGGAPGGGTPAVLTAKINAIATAVAGVAVNFDGSASTPPTGGTIASYNWNFGDGGSATGATATHTYVAAGTDTVTLTVTDGTGATNVATQTITIQAAGTAAPPTAKAGGPYTGTAGNPVQFNGSGSSAPAGTIASYAWNFGDNSAVDVMANPIHTYTAAGAYTVMLTVTDNTGLTGNTQTTATITAAAGGGGGVVTPPGGGGTPSPSAGGALYAANCESCHGVNGVGGPDGSVVGESASDITEAIAEVPTMASLSTLTSAEIDEIAAFLQQAADDDDEDDEAAGSGGAATTTRGSTTSTRTRPTTTTARITTTTVAAAATGTRSRPNVATDTAPVVDGGSSGGGSVDWLFLAASGAWFARRRKIK